MGQIFPKPPSKETPRTLLVSTSPRGSPPAPVSRSPPKCTLFPSSPRASLGEKRPGGSGVTRAGLWRRSTRPGSSVPHCCLPAAGSRMAAENGARFCFLRGESPGLPVGHPAPSPAAGEGKGQAGSKRHGSAPNGAACGCRGSGGAAPASPLRGRPPRLRTLFQAEKLQIRASCNHPGHAGVTAETFPR